MPVHQDPTHQKALGSANFVLLTPKETSNRLKVSLSWLAKAAHERRRSALREGRP